MVQVIDAWDKAIVEGRKVYYKSLLTRVFMNSDAYSIGGEGGGKGANHEPRFYLGS